MKIKSAKVLILALAVFAFAGAASADTLFTSSSADAFCCFTVNLHQNVGSVSVTVSLLAPATYFAQTGGPHAGFAFNLDQSITGSNIGSPVDLSTFHVGPKSTGFGTFGYYFDIPGSGTSGFDSGPLTFNVVLSGVTIADFTTNGSGYYFAADILAGTAGTGEAGINTPGTGTTVPEPSSMLLLGTGLAGLAGVVRRKLRG